MAPNTKYYIYLQQIDYRTEYAMGTRMLTVSIINPDGSQTEVFATWEAVKEAFDYAILEPVYLEDGAVLLVDEDGLSKQLPYNDLASRIAQRLIVGPAALVRKHLVKKVLD